jgi:hypothetical protein
MKHRDTIVIESLARASQPLLDQPFIRRVRRNHGLEHATVHVLSEKVKTRPLAGRSDAGGFWLLGDVETELVRWAVDEALRRMRGGERHLAIHPGCGTARLTTATLAGVAAISGTFGARRSVGGYLMRLPTIILLTMGAILFAEPLGLQLQEHFTTLGDLGDLDVLDIERKPGKGFGGMIVHRVTTRST